MIRSIKGVTLTEAIISVAILGSLSILLPIFVKIFNTLRYQQELVAAQREAKVFLEQFTTDVRNAAYMEVKHSSHAVIYAYDLERTPNFDKYALFNSNTWGTINYLYNDENFTGNDMNQNGSTTETYMIRISSFVHLTNPGVGAPRVKRDVYLRKLIVPPDNNPVTEDWIFRRPQRQTMEAQLRLRFPFMKPNDDPKTYRATMDMRKENIFGI